MRLDYSAISDVGRVRKDNQDSGYAGAHLLAVCDGVGGAARGDIASATTIQQLRSLDDDAVSTGPDDPERRLAPDPDLRCPAARPRPDRRAGRRGPGARGHQHHRDASRSSTAPGSGSGHVGDSRAYLFRDGEISQLTSDHTFVQGLVDEGRITEAEARVHPHRNLILRAVDGIHDLEPDLFVLELVVGDRLLLCSDGACGVLDDGRLADILSGGSPDYAAVELVRASLEAGSSDNVTCLVADVKADDAQRRARQPRCSWARPPSCAGAAGGQGRRPQVASLFRGHRAGDTGELEPIAAEILDEVPFAIKNDPADPESARYAPRPRRASAGSAGSWRAFVVVGLIWAGLAVAWSWIQRPVLRRRAGRRGRHLPRTRRLTPRARPLRALRDAATWT